MLKKIGKAGTVVIGILAVLLIASVVFNILFIGKNKRLTGEYESLSDNYEKIGREMLEAKNDANNKDRTIQDLNAEVEKLEKSVSDYSKALDLATKNIYLSENHYLSGSDYNILRAVAGDEIRVDSAMYYAFYSGSYDVSISTFSDKTGLIETKSYKAGESYFVDFGSACDFITVDRPDLNEVLVSTGVSVSDNQFTEGRFFYVVGKNSPYTLTVSDAVSYLEECGTVLVLPGEYNENIHTKDKEVNIAGVDRDKCIIYSNDNDYYNPALEISAGKVSNISLKAIDDGRGLGSSLKAYAVHADFDYMYGHDLTFENCIIYSDYNAGAGVGLRGEGTLSFINCELTGYYHGLFVHDSKEQDLGGNQNLVAEGCTFTGINGDVALVLSSCIADEGNITVKFVNNTLTNLYAPESENLFAAVNEDLQAYDGFYMNLKNFHLDESSAGNSVEAMNYK